MMLVEKFMECPECTQIHHGHSVTNPVTLSDAPTDYSAPGDPCLETLGIQDDTKILAHYSDALDEMAQSLMDLEDGYFKALCEVIWHTEKALHNISHIDTYYVSHVITLMTSW